MAGKDLSDLFEHQLKDIYFAEHAISKAVPKMIEAAQNADLKTTLAVHLDETKAQIERLDEIFKTLGRKPEGVECKGIEGILAEGDEIIEEFGSGVAIDAALIAVAQGIEHYEITRYGTLLAWAKQLGMDEAAELLEATLVEEENTDEILSDLAEETANPTATA